MRHERGDTLAEDLGEDVYDLVIANNLVHHFTEADNDRLTARAFRALRSGGTFVIGDLEKSAAPGAWSALGGTMDLYFALTSTSGTWPVVTMREWQRNSGFTSLRTLRMREMPGFVLQLGQKP